MFSFKVSKNPRPMIPVWPSEPWHTQPTSQVSWPAAPNRSQNWAEAQRRRSSFSVAAPKLSNELPFRLHVSQASLLLKLFSKPTSFPWLFTPRGLLILGARIFYLEWTGCLFLLLYCVFVLSLSFYLFLLCFYCVWVTAWHFGNLCFKTVTNQYRFLLWWKTSCTSLRCLIRSLMSVVFREMVCITKKKLPFCTWGCFHFMSTVQDRDHMREVQDGAML